MTLRDLYVEADSHDRAVRESIEGHRSRNRNRQRTEPWAPPGRGMTAAPPEFVTAVAEGADEPAIGCPDEAQLVVFFHDG